MKNRESIFRWLSSRFSKTQTDGFSIQYKGNQIRSNVDIDALTATFNPNWDGEIEVTYNDGKSKLFDREQWHLFGDKILTNLPGLKIDVK